MIPAGTGVALKGKKITLKSSEESNWLYLILHAIYNHEVISSDILNALGGTVTNYNTVHQYDLLSSQTKVFLPNTVHGVSFSVIKGTAIVSLDGGATTITYSAGQNINLLATTTFNGEIDFTIPGTLNDGVNETTVQSITL